MSDCVTVWGGHCIPARLPRNRGALPGFFVYLKGETLNKTEVIPQWLCTKQEREALELVAQVEGIKRPELLRQLVRDAAKDRGLWPPPAPLPAEEQAEVPHG